MTPVVAIEIDRDEDGVVTDLRLVFADGSSGSVRTEPAAFAMMDELLEELSDFYDSTPDPEEESEDEE
jgi:hypothetical protein